jgi:hypothetical protein
MFTAWVPYMKIKQKLNAVICDGYKTQNLQENKVKQV